MTSRTLACLSRKYELFEIMSDDISIYFKIYQNVTTPRRLLLPQKQAGLAFLDTRVNTVS